MNLYIVRGLPGAGKSTFGRKLAEERHALFVEPDIGCYRNGKYCYSPKDYHRQSLYARGFVEQAAICGWDVVFADVLPKRENVQWIVDAYRKGVFTPYNDVRRNTPVHVFTLKITRETSLRRNIHNVKPEDIKAMCDAWEDWEGETIIDAETEEGK